MMYMPSIFGSDMFEDFFRDLDQGYAPKALYGKRAKNLMKTDIREDEKGYQLAIDPVECRGDGIQRCVHRQGFGCSPSEPTCGIAPKGLLHENLRRTEVCHLSTQKDPKHNG